jgi:hypothetical protein
LRGAGFVQSHQATRNLFLITYIFGLLKGQELGAGEETKGRAHLMAQKNYNPVASSSPAPNRILVGCNLVFSHQLILKWF